MVIKITYIDGKQDFVKAKKEIKEIKIIPINIGVIKKEIEEIRTEEEYYKFYNKYLNLIIDFDDIKMERKMYLIGKKERKRKTSLKDDDIIEIGLKLENKFDEIFM